MTKREIAEMFMEIYAAVDKFQCQMDDIGIDTGASVLQEIMIPDNIAKLYGLTSDTDRAVVWSENVSLDFEETGSIRAFLDHVEVYAEKIHNASRGRGK